MYFMPLVNRSSGTFQVATGRAPDSWWQAAVVGNDWGVPVLPFLLAYDRPSGLRCTMFKQPRRGTS